MREHGIHEDILFEELRASVEKVRAHNQPCLRCDDLEFTQLALDLLSKPKGPKARLESRPAKGSHGKVKPTETEGAGG